MGDRLMVGQATLDRLVGVQIPVPQPHEKTPAGFSGRSLSVGVWFTQRPVRYSRGGQAAIRCLSRSLLHPAPSPRQPRGSETAYLV